MTSWETLPILKEALLELTMGHSTTHISVFIMGKTNEFILELDVLHTYDTFIELGCHVLRLGQEE